MYPYNTSSGDRDQFSKFEFADRDGSTVDVQRRPGSESKPPSPGPKPPSPGPKPPSPGPKPPSPGPKPPSPGPKPPSPGPKPPSPGPKPPSPGPKPPSPGPKPPSPGPKPPGPGPKPPGPGPKPPSPGPKPPGPGPKPPGPGPKPPGPGPRPPVVVPRPPAPIPAPPINIWPRPIVITVPIQSTVVDMIYDAIADERGDEEYFAALMRMALTETEIEILNEIRMDEQKHYYLLEEVYYSITGRRPRNIINRRFVGNDLRREYEKAVFDELKDVEFYRKMLFSVDNREIRDILYEIITDEQSHAVKLNYLLTLYR